MVIITRSAYKKACESFNSSDVTQNNIIPPWCSSGKVYERRKSRQVAAPKWEMRSTYPLRENIWEYLYEDNAKQNFNCSNKRRNRRCKQTPVKTHCCKKTAACFLGIMILAIGTIVSVSFWKENLEGDLTKLISLSFSDTPTSVSEECCHRLKYLAEQLAKAELTLRNTLRSRTMMLSARTKTVSVHDDSRYIAGAVATKGDDTKEWGGRVALWGLVPLWRAAAPPNIVLSNRPPTLSDCWPFIGSYGEIIIRLPKIQRISYVTLEHIHPDTARSAPKHFVIYGILVNNTRIKVVDGQYRADGPGKQYYPLAYKHVEWKSLLFRVLTNQGNKKYTCIYRIHLFGKVATNLASIDSVINE
ncbi:uncharacterized protein LOC142974765 [Anticarsia gemmatalis]|uniref:uncharacterized protein LOC142974765 n=1 Tax=Anticarsia gemmatalis TaxID=129554 RepID=UPI003F760320